MLVGCLLLAWSTACAHEVIWLGDDPEPWVAPTPPIGFTIALDVQSFEAKRLVEKPFVDRFARTLKDANLFQGVIYPIPDGFEPLWEIKLLVRDELDDPDSNFWKAFLSNAFFPFRLFLYQEEGYTVYTEALITRRDVVIASYATQAPVRHRFQAYSLQKELEAAELILRESSDALLGAIATDARKLDAEDEARAGT